MTSGWPRIAVHADMDAFYAAVERLDGTLDVVHERFGEAALTRARHLDRGSGPGP